MTSPEIVGAPGQTLHRTGVSDKYGQIYAERVRRGFDDPSEPVAVLRAEDTHAYYAMLYYLRRCDADPEVSDAQLQSVNRQVQAFLRYRLEHPDRIRTPGE